EDGLVLAVVRDELRELAALPRQRAVEARVRERLRIREAFLELHVAPNGVFELLLDGRGEHAQSRARSRSRPGRRETWPACISVGGRAAAGSESRPGFIAVGAGRSPRRVAALYFPGRARLTACAGSFGFAGSLGAAAASFVSSSCAERRLSLGVPTETFSFLTRRFFSFATMAIRSSVRSFANLRWNFSTRPAEST